MRRLACLVALTFGCAQGGVARGVDAAAPVAAGLHKIAERIALALQPRGTSRVAVMGLVDLRGNKTPLTNYLTDKLVAGLAAAEGLTVIERSRVAEILEEHAFAMSGVVDPASASEIGGLVAADVLVVGAVTVLAEEIDITARAVEAATGSVLAAVDVRVARAPLAAYVEADAPVALAPPLALSTLVFGERQKAGRYEEVVVREGTALSSGDGLKLVFETNREAYVYALLLDSQGRGSVIFPHADIASSNRIAGGRQVEIPPGDQWFFLDDHKGTETIYVLASIDPMKDVAGLARRLESLGKAYTPAAADEEVARFADAPLHRGIEGVKKGGAARVQLSDGGYAEQARDLLNGAGTVVRAVSFEHQ